jgi:hypothetical protein
LLDGKFSAFGSGKDRLDEEWEKQQATLADRRKQPQSRQGDSCLSLHASVLIKQQHLSEKNGTGGPTGPFTSGNWPMFVGGFGC